MERSLPQIYNANASIIKKDNRTFKESIEVKWQYLFSKDVGSSKGYEAKILRLNKRIRSYGRSVYESQPDYNWDVHNTIQETALSYPRKDTVWIGNARDMLETNSRLFFYAGLLHKPCDADFYNLHVYMADKTFKLRLQPQAQKNYPYRGDWQSDVDLEQQLGGKWGW